MSSELREVGGIYTINMSESLNLRTSLSVQTILLKPVISRVSRPIMCENCNNISSALASLSAEIHSMANINVIDPEGDVILICGEIEFQVSSKVLSLASPVFKALFGPCFAEGQPTSRKASRIQLPDDDAESMRFMCAVLHHKCASAQGIGLERLEKLAVVTDKYDVCMFSNSIHPDGNIDLVAKRILGFVGARSPCQSL